MAIHRIALHDTSEKPSLLLLHPASLDPVFHKPDWQKGHGRQVNLVRMNNIQATGGPDLMMTLQLFATLVLGLMCGSELSVAAFAHPALNRQPLDLHVPMRSSFAARFGRVMPFWMAGSTLLSLLLLLPFEHLSESAWRLAAIALAIQVIAVLCSLAGPVPINNRIAEWTPETIPADWKERGHRWDLYHWFRTGGLTAGFAILAGSIVLR